MQERIVELEIKLAYQEKTLNELSDVVLDQQRHIERVEKQLDALKRQITAGAQPDAAPPADDPPPHY